MKTTALIQASGFVAWSFFTVAAGVFPGFHELPAAVRAVELQSRVIHVIHRFHERGGVRFHFLQQRAAIDDLAARRAHHATED
ncbi:MAG: hypothetical protein EXS35_14595 [Pedosphaera sp.]|nr:hypothetical protein [Pedosphaera sp.]